MQSKVNETDLGLPINTDTCTYISRFLGKVKFDSLITLLLQAMAPEADPACPAQPAPGPLGLIHSLVSPVTSAIPAHKPHAAYRSASPSMRARLDSGRLKTQCPQTNAHVTPALEVCHVLFCTSCCYLVAQPHPHILNHLNLALYWSMCSTGLPVCSMVQMHAIRRWLR